MHIDVRGNPTECAPFVEYAFDGYTPRVGEVKELPLGSVQRVHSGSLFWFG